MEPGLETERKEAAFAIDDQQRIVFWSYAAATLLGIPRKTAIGQTCYDLVGGEDPFGKAVCGANCSAVRSLRVGHITARCSLLTSVNGNGARNRFLCELVAFPDHPGGALATLSEAQADPTTSANGLPSTVWSPASSPESVLRDMTALAKLSLSLSSDNLEHSIDQALDWLRETAGVEMAELFVVEPQGGDALLCANRGPFRAAFSQIVRFRHGEGYPGLVVSGREPVTTCNLPDDPRYLRARVKEKGFYIYVCVPLFAIGTRRVIGVLNVASRQRGTDTERILRLLTWASQPISNALQASLLQAREDIAAKSLGFLQDTEQDFDDLLRAVLHQMVTTGGAAGGALLLYDRNEQRPVRRVTEGDFNQLLCTAITSGDPRTCPSLLDGHGLALYNPRHRWPSPCQQVPPASTLVHCLPLMADGQAVGIVQLGYVGQVPSPPTRYLGTLLAVAERASQVIKQVNTGLQNQQLAQTRLSARIQQQSRELTENGVTLQRPGRFVEGAVTQPLLEIRCFGSFELYSRGELITPEMFQRRGALTLLKILLLYNGRQVSRDALVELLWPEADPEAGANRLYVLTHALRQMVEPPQHDKRWNFIRSDADRYYFNLDSSCWLDIKEFQEWIDLGERLEQARDDRGAIDAFEEAVSLYRGDLLEEELSAEWCWQEREHLKELCLAVLSKLATHYLGHDSPDKSIERYRHALRIDSVREENHRGLMRAFWAAGRRDEALRQYQVCYDILLRELEVTPLHETEQLHLLIRGDSNP